VSLAYVDDEKPHPVTVFLKKVIETHGPVHDGGAGAATKNLRHWFVPGKVGEANRVLAVDVAQTKVVSDVSCLRGIGVLRCCLARSFLRVRMNSDFELLLLEMILLLSDSPLPFK
jgi:hypothetical protein